MAEYRSIVYTHNTSLFICPSMLGMQTGAATPENSRFKGSLKQSYPATQPLHYWVFIQRLQTQ